MNLLFEPSQSVNSRALALQQEVDKLRRSRGRLMFFNILLFILFLSALFGAGAAWFFSQNQLASAEERVERAEVDAEAAAESADEERRRADSNAAQARLLAVYEPLAEREEDLKELQDRLDYYRSTLANTQTPGLNREETLNVKLPETQWNFNLREDELNQQIATLATALERIENWIDRTDIPNPPRRAPGRCNPFKSDIDPDC